MTGLRASDGVPFAVWLDRNDRPGWRATRPDPCDVTSVRCGRANGLGASTVMPGSELEVCGAAGLHCNIVATMATAEIGKRRDDFLIIGSPTSLFSHWKGPMYPANFCMCRF
jgi:hypothetical protein